MLNLHHSCQYAQQLVNVIHFYFHVEYQKLCCILLYVATHCTVFCNLCSVLMCHFHVDAS